MIRAEGRSARNHIHSLKKELAHHCEGVSVFTTHEEISLHVDRFEWVVQRIIKPHVEAA